MTPELYHPVLDCFVRGLSHAYRKVDAEEGTTVVLNVSGECGGQWCLIKQRSRWAFDHASGGHIAAVITIPQEIAWRVFTKGIAQDEALSQSDLRGNRDLAEIALRFIAIVG